MQSSETYIFLFNLKINVSFIRLYKLLFLIVSYIYKLLAIKCMPQDDFEYCNLLLPMIMHKVSVAQSHISLPQ